MENESLILKDEAYAFTGACFETNRELGCGFLESVYQEGLALEFGRRGIPFEQQVGLGLEYKGTTLNSEFVADFVCHGKIIIEIKPVAALAEIHRAQVLHYLKITRKPLGLPVNFGEHPKAVVERFAATRGMPRVDRMNFFAPFRVFRG